MAIPSVNLFSNMPGGGMNAAMNANNALANNMHLRELNRIKAKYAPITTQAEALSKLAYANLMGPQFLAKMMGNPDLVANLTEPEIKNNINTINRAGNGQGTAAGLLNTLQGSIIPDSSPSGNPLANIGQFIADKFKGMFQQENAQQSMPANSLVNPQPNIMPQAPPMPQSLPSVRPKGGVSIEGQQWYDKNGNPVYSEEIEDDGNPIELEMTTGQRPERELTYAEKAGRQKGIINEGGKLGDYRAEAVKNIGEQQLQLSNTGANLDRIVEDINAPEFMALRKDFPFYQDMQLTALSKIGNPEQQEMIGNFIADVKSFAGATVNSFKGQSMKREFDYADQLKPNENDTVNTARGKLTALKSLKEIAERKNNIILDLMQNKHMNLGDATKKANSMIDVKAIGNEVKKLTSPMITLKDPKNPSITIRLPLWEARKRGVKNV